MAALIAGIHGTGHAEYAGSSTVVPGNSPVQTAALEILGNGGGAGIFNFKGGGNAVDAAVAAGLAACVVMPQNCSLGGYGGHMLIWKAGHDGEPQFITSIDFNSAAGSLATSNMFEANVDPATGKWIGPTPTANAIGWKAVGVPGTLAGLVMAQTNYGRKVDGTNYFPFAEIIKPSLARVVNGQVSGNGYYSLSSVSNLLMELYTNSPGYLDTNGNPNPHSINNPHAVFYTGGIAMDIVAAMQANGGLVTYTDMTNYRAREVTPFSRHFNPPDGTPATVFVAPPGSSGLSVLQQLAMINAVGWTDGPDDTWDNLRHWHSRAEAARLMWKEHFQWLGDPWSGVLPPDVLGNGSTNFGEQLLARVTTGYPHGCPWDTNEIPLTNSLADAIINAVNNQSNVAISVNWDDIRYGTCHISTSDRWGNCVSMTLSMGGGFGAQVAVPGRGLVMGQGMALFDPRPGWPDSIAPGKRPVNNMSPVIVVPDYPGSTTNGMGGRPPLAIGAVGGSTIPNNVSAQIANYLMEGPSSSINAPAHWLFNFEGNKIIYMRTSYPTGVQGYLASVGLTAPGGPPSVGQLTYVEGWIPPVIVTQPAGTNISSGGTVVLSVTATGLPLFYQWYRNGIALNDGGTISGAQTPQLTVSSIASGAAFTVVVSNGGSSVSSEPAGVSVDGELAIVAQPVSRANFEGTLATFSVTAIGAGTLGYQWTKNGALLTNGGNVSGANDSELSLANVSTSDAAIYAVIVTNLAGSVTSAPATLTVTQPHPPGPLFLYEPFDYANIGGPASANTPANWTFGGTGANDLSVVSGNLTWPGLAPSIGNSVTNGGNGLGVRRLLGTNLNSGIVYFSALLRINDLGFGAWTGVSSTLGALTAPDNSSFRLHVLVRSNSPAGYVIGTQKSGAGATATFDPTERYAGETVFLVGKYDFTVSPNRASLWIKPDSATFGASEPTTGSISATTGTDGFSIDRFNIRQNAASGSFSVPGSIQWDELRFGFSWADVTPTGLPTITSHPDSRTNLAGTLATFSVTATGIGPLAYQWTKNGAPLANGGNVSGANDSELNLANVSSFDAGTYAVIVSNFTGGITSAPATLTVTQSYSAGPLFLYEPFDYPNIGGPVSSNAPANWTFGGTGANDLSVVSGNLTSPGLAPSIGNSVTNGGNGLGVRRLLGTNLNSGIVYFSALLRINDLGFGAWTGVSSTLGALTAPNNTSFRLNVLVRSNSPAGYVIGTQKSGAGTTATFDTTERYAGETVFLVGKYDFTVSPNVASLWINPDSVTFGAASEPAGGFISATTGTDGLSIDRFNIRQNAATGSFSVPASIQWDELRFGFSWADVTPPAPVTILGNAVKPGDGSFQFGYTNNGVNYSVYASTNLIHWTPIGAATEVSPGLYQFIDTNANNYERRFYQLRSP